MTLKVPGFVSVMALALMVLVFSSEALQAQEDFGKEIQNMLDGLDEEAAFESATWSAMLMRVSDGSVLASRHADRLLIPASVQKLAVTYVAWKLLGPGFRFQTLVETDGHVHDGVLDGSLYIRGRGDPTLGSSRFAGMGKDSVFSTILGILRGAGIREIKGGLIADPDIFDSQMIPGSWSWEDMGNYYASGVSGLNFNENQLEFVFKPGRLLGEPASLLRVEPPVQGLDIENLVISGAENSGDQVVIYGAPYDLHRVLRGSVPLGKKEFPVKGSLPDPALLMVQYLHAYLAIHDIHVADVPSTVQMLRRRGITISAGRRELGRIFSPDLRSLLDVAHEKSVNLYADCLLKYLGYFSKQDGSYPSGIKALNEFWAGQKIPVTGFIARDGSGLSLSNRISARHLSNMMRVICQDPEGEDFLKTLNHAGEKGDIGALLPEGACKGRLRAKSGYMKTVRSYAGHIQSVIPGNDGLVFVVIVNHDGNSNLFIKQKIKHLFDLFCRFNE